MKPEEIAAALDEIRIGILTDMGRRGQNEIDEQDFMQRTYESCGRLFAARKQVDGLADLDPDPTLVVLSLARFDELRQAEEDLQDVRVTTAEHEPEEDLRGEINRAIQNFDLRLNEFARWLKSYAARLAEVESVTK